MPLRRLHLPQRQRHLRPRRLLDNKKVTRLHLAAAQPQRQKLKKHPRENELLLLQPRVEHVQHLECTRVHRLHPVSFHTSVLAPPIEKWRG